MIAITGASGQLGRLTIDELLRNGVPAATIAALVRTPERVADLAARGVEVRRADYEDRASLDAALAGVDKLLLISSNELGRRAAQHEAVIAAARRARVGLLAYTSVLHADTSKLGLAAEHRATEQMLEAAAVPHVLLRNGWYTENYAASIPAALAHGALIGSAGEGRIASAARADYAAAAAAVLIRDDQAGQVHELAGDVAYTLTEFAAQIARQSGNAVEYRNLSRADFKAAMLAAGLPEGFAELLSDLDTAASQGALFENGGALKALIGRPTTPFAQTIGATLQASTH